MSCTRDCGRFAPVELGPEGLYFHVPFCDGKCPYCAFYSVRYERGMADRFVSCAGAELERYCAAGRTPAPVTVYIGGGTPTALTAPQIERLCRIVTDNVSMERLEEWTVEANPGSIDKDKADALVSAGVNRMSVGAQSFSDGVLKLLGRRHSVSDAYRAVDVIRKSGISNIGIDLIACVPGARREWARTLAETVAIAPSHVSVYALAAEEGTVLAERRALGEFEPEDDESELASLSEAEQALGEAGYVRYEISNYALPGFDCVHNVGCWRGAEYVGIGPSAASFHNGARRTNAASLQEYVESLEGGNLPPADPDRISPLTRAAELVAFGLRMKAGVDMNEIHRMAGGNLDGQFSKWAQVLGELKKEGVVTGEGAKWALTSRGRDIADYVAVELMP